MSTRTRSTIALTMLLLGPSACLKPNPLALLADEGESVSEFGSDSDGDVESESGELPDLFDSTDSTDSSSTDSSSTDSTDSSSTDSNSTDSNSSDTGVCEAPVEFEPGCGVCLAQSCCTSLVPCGDDPVCVCLADCLFAGNSDNQCRMLCGMKPADVAPLAPLLACASQDCPDCYVP